MDTSKHWVVADVLKRHKPKNIRDFENLLGQDEIDRVSKSICLKCHDWFGSDGIELFNLHVDLVLAEALDLIEHDAFDEETVDIIVLTVGNVLTANVVKTGIDWYFMHIYNGKILPFSK